MKKFILIALSVFAPVLTFASGLPQANFVVSPVKGRIATEFEIDARQSRNSAGNLGGVEIRFKYDNGNWSEWTRRTLQSFVPMDTGKMRVQVQVRDTQTGQVQTTFRTVEVIRQWNRRAWISVDKNTAAVGEPVDFLLSLALNKSDNDPDFVQVRWDFDSDGDWDTKFSRQKYISHVFDTATKTSPTAEVMFFDGEILTVRGITPRRSPNSRMIQPVSKWDKLRITSPVIVAPIINVSPRVNGLSEDTVFTFTTENLRIPRGGWIEWSFDGQQWLRFPNKTQAVHKFTSAGKHEVRTRVCIGYSQPRCEETTTELNLRTGAIDFRVDILLQNKTNPGRAYRTSQNSQNFIPVEVGDRIRFTSRILQYGGGQTFAYRWDFNSDGVWDTHFSSQKYTEHVFDRGGEFTVTVEARDGDGLTESHIRRILVTNNEKPTAEIGLSQEIIYQGERVRFTPIFPTGNLYERSMNQLRFDLDGDGTWDSDFRGISGQEWIYNQSGEVTIRMQLRDRGKNVTTVFKKIYVNPLPEVKARVTVSARKVEAGAALQFDASNSNGRKLRYIWNFDSLGSLQTGAMWNGKGVSNAKASHVWREVGEKTVSLLAIDEAGKGDQIFFPVTVVAPTNSQSGQGMTRWSLAR